MHHREHSPRPRAERDESFSQAPLPPELAGFLKHRPYACLMQATDHGTVFVIKAPARDIESVRGRVPVQLRYELYEHPAAPVIRTVIAIYDQPGRPLALETFTNIEDPQQRADFAALADQKDVYLLFYDQSLTHRLSKGITHTNHEVIPRIVEHADRLLAATPKEEFDFDRAKAAVMEVTHL